MVLSTLKYLMKDSLHVCTGEAVRNNCQTVREWRLSVSPVILLLLLPYFIIILINSNASTMMISGLTILFALVSTMPEPM